MCREGASEVMDRDGAAERREPLRPAGRRRADGTAPTLLASLPHEIRRSLGVIQILAGAAVDGEPARGIAQEVRRLDRLVDAIDRVARAVSGDGEAVRAPIDAGLAARSALLAFSADPDRCPVVERIPDGLPSVEGDHSLVERVLVNLLANASRHGGAPVSLDVAAAGDWVEMTVGDAGPGIPATHAAGEAGLFNGSGTPGSMGVGLAISRLFAEVMGGCLTVAPAAPGARVTLRLRTTA